MEFINECSTKLQVWMNHIKQWNFKSNREPVLKNIPMQLQKYVCHGHTVLIVITILRE